MKNRIAKIIAVIAGVALITAGIGSSAFALTGNNEQNTEETVQEKAEKIVSDLIAGDTEDKPVKDETVYVIAGEDGSVKKIIVSDWLSLPMRQDLITLRKSKAMPTMFIR